MMYPLVEELAAEKIPVVTTCRVLGFSRQGFYVWRARPIGDRELESAYLVNLIHDIHQDEPFFGSERVWDALAQDHGVLVGVNRVEKLMRDNGIAAASARRKPKSAPSGPPVHDDLVGRDFRADKPNEKWLTDITEHPTSEGKLYLCVVKDCFSNRIVGWSIDSHMRKSLACRALVAAIGSRPHQNTIIHSDRGSQFRSHAYTELIAKHGLRGSMGRVGACGDNAAMESFFARLQVEVLDTQTWLTRKDLQLAMFTWIETKYNRTRRQKRLGRTSPIQFELLTHGTQIA
jgi:putative transposase